MFGRELKTKLPEIRREQSLLDESMRERDWSQKLAQKAYADKMWGATPNPIILGDQVLLRNTKTTGPKFETKPYTVVTKRNGNVVIRVRRGSCLQERQLVCKTMFFQTIILIYEHQRTARHCEGLRSSRNCDRTC